MPKPQKDPDHLRNTEPSPETGIPVAVSIPHFQQRYDVGRTFTYDLIKSGEIEARKAGRRTLITVESAERWFARLKRLITGDEVK